MPLTLFSACMPPSPTRQLAEQLKPQLSGHHCSIKSNDKDHTVSITFPEKSASQVLDAVRHLDGDRTDDLRTQQVTLRFRALHHDHRSKSCLVEPTRARALSDGSIRFPPPAPNSISDETSLMAASLLDTNPHATVEGLCRRYSWPSVGIAAKAMEITLQHQCAQATLHEFHALMDRPPKVIEQALLAYVEELRIWQAAELCKQWHVLMQSFAPALETMHAWTQETEDQGEKLIREILQTKFADAYRELSNAALNPQLNVDHILERMQHFESHANALFEKMDSNQLILKTFSQFGLFCSLARVLQNAKTQLSFQGMLITQAEVKAAKEADKNDCVHIYEQKTGWSWDGRLSASDAYVQLMHKADPDEEKDNLLRKEAQKTGLTLVQSANDGTLDPASNDASIAKRLVLFATLTHLARIKRNTYNLTVTGTGPVDTSPSAQLMRDAAMTVKQGWQLLADFYHTLYPNPNA